MTKISINRENALLIKKISRIQSILDHRGGDSLLFFGSRQHTEELISCLYLPKKAIRVCNTHNAGNQKWIYASGKKYTIEKPGPDIFEWADQIIISSSRKHREIQSYLKQFGVHSDKIINIQDEFGEEPFYSANIETNVDKLKDVLYQSDKYGKLDKTTSWIGDGKGEWYEEKVEKHFFDVVTKHYFLKYIHPGDTVLDVGAGTGRLSLELAKKEAKVTAVDTSIDMLKVLRKKDASIDTLVVHDEHLPFSDNSFDAVVSCDCIMHFLNWKEFLKEHSRVVKPNGYIIYTLWNDTHLQYISPEKSVRINWITGHQNGVYASVTKEELESACEEIGELQLVSMIPYSIFAPTAFSCGILSQQEMLQFSQSFLALCENEDLRNLIADFERNIVSGLPPEKCVLNVCIFKKNSCGRVSL